VKACTQCGLSIGDTATFCQVCGALVKPVTTPEIETLPALLAMADSPASLAVADTPVALAVADTPVALAAPTDDDRPAASSETDNGSHDGGSTEPDQSRLDAAAAAVAEARACEKSDDARAVALYRQAIVEYLGAGDDPLDVPGVGGRLVFAFERLSLALKRSGAEAEALEEIDSAAALGLLERTDFGPRKTREALAKRAVALRKALAENVPA